LAKYDMLTDESRRNVCALIDSMLSVPAKEKKGLLPDGVTLRQAVSDSGKIIHWRTGGNVSYLVRN